MKIPTLYPQTEIQQVEPAKSKVGKAVRVPKLHTHYETFTNRLTGRTVTNQINQHGYPALWDN